VAPPRGLSLTIKRGMTEDSAEDSITGVNETNSRVKKQFQGGKDGWGDLGFCFMIIMAPARVRAVLPGWKGVEKPGTDLRGLKNISQK